MRVLMMVFGIGMLLLGCSKGQKQTADPRVDTTREQLHVILDVQEQRKDASEWARYLIPKLKAGLDLLDSHPPLEDPVLLVSGLGKDASNNDVLVLWFLDGAYTVTGVAVQIDDAEPQEFPVFNWDAADRKWFAATLLRTEHVPVIREGGQSEPGGNRDFKHYKNNPIHLPAWSSQTHVRVRLLSTRGRQPLMEADVAGQPETSPSTVP